MLQSGDFSPLSTDRPHSSQYTFISHKNTATEQFIINQLSISNDFLCFLNIFAFAFVFVRLSRSIKNKKKINFLPIFNIFYCHVFHTFYVKYQNIFILQNYKRAVKQNEIAINKQPDTGKKWNLYNFVINPRTANINSRNRLKINTCFRIDFVTIRREKNPAITQTQREKYYMSDKSNKNRPIETRKIPVVVKTFMTFV